MIRVRRGLLNRWWRFLSTLGRLSKRHLPSGPVVGLVGPKWLAHLLSAEARVVQLSSAGLSKSPAELALVLVGPKDNHDFGSGVNQAPVPLVGYRSDVEPAVDPAPFVEPTLSNPLQVKVPEGLPDDFGLLARQAARTVDASRPSVWHSPEADTWLAQTASAHPSYRQAHSRRARDLLEEALSVAGRPIPPQDEEVTVVCVTNRPASLDNILSNYRRQRYTPRRLLVVTNSELFNEHAVVETLSTVPDSSCIRIDESRSLGECLNVALDSCTTRFLAKIDDDDWYGPHYLGDLVIAQRFADAAVVGKHTYYAYIEEIDQTVIRFPGREFEYTSFVAGGTLMIDVPLVAGIRFPDRTIGEDTGFIAACQRKGLGVFSSDRFNYLQVRGGDNTWKTDLDDYLAKTLPAAPGTARDLVEV